MDERRRRLERTAAQGDAAARTSLLAERLRLGELPRERTMLWHDFDADGATDVIAAVAREKKKKRQDLAADHEIATQFTFTSE